MRAPRSAAGTQTRCPKCGARVPPKSNYCPHCGRPIAVAEIRLPEAERRQVTVLFSDLVGSTALSAQLDPEDLRALMVAYHRDCSRVIEDAGGFVARYMGDGILAYFGYPRAHEDDPERAVRAGLAAVETIGQLKIPSGEPVQGRIGIASGIVIVGDLVGKGPAQERGVVGETPNLAARLLTIAEPGSVVIGPITRLLLGGLFEYRDLGPVALKGFARPVAAFQVLRPNAATSRFEARQERGILPLVGREGELALIAQRWHAARAGEGQLVLLTGEPGVGKSRIARAVQDRLAEEPHFRLRYFCSPHYTQTTLHPIITYFERTAGFVHGEPAEARRAKLEKELAKSGASKEETGAIAGLLGIPYRHYRLRDLGPQKRKEKVFSALIAQATNLAARRPLLITYDDVHWCDPATLELLGLFAEHMRQLPVLLLATARPEFRPPWPADAAHVTELAIERLNRAGAIKLVDRIIGGRTLPAGVAERILDRAEGVPLFIEELTKFMLESGAIPGANGRHVPPAMLPARAIPTTLHGSLMARVDRLPSARDVLQAGAALGRTFSFEMVSAVASLPEERVQGALHELVRSELVFCSGAPPQADYTFKHSLVQDAAYDSMLRGRRIELHGRIADVLEQRFPGVAEAEPETLARHFAGAGLAEKAIEYWLAAGRRALRRGISREAISHLTAGIALLPEAPESGHRTRLEISLLAALAAASTMTSGYAAPHIEQALSRAHELCRSLGDAELAIPVLRGMTTMNWAWAKLEVAKNFALEMIRTSEQIADQEALLVAHGMLAGVLWHLGDFDGSEEHGRKLLVEHSRQSRRNIVARFGEDTPSTTLPYHALNLIWSGHLDQAEAVLRDARTYARLTEHPYSLGFVLMRESVCHVLLRDPAAVAAAEERSQAIGQEFGFPQLLALADIMLGWASALGAKAESGIAQIRDGIARYQSSGSLCPLPFFIMLLADAMLARGDIDGAIANAGDGLRRAAATSEHGADCLLLCVRGDALSMAGAHAGAEADYRAAIDWSRERNARWGELYAGLRLARLWHRGGDSARARELLAPLCGWFPQRLDNPVLREARALLAML